MSKSEVQSCHKFLLLGPETSNVLIVNAETVAEIRMCYNRNIHARIAEIGHVWVDVVMPPLTPLLPAGFAADLIAAARVPTSGVPGCSTIEKT
jgi:hypothetical protein